jgi:hypothetical protein
VNSKSTPPVTARRGKPPAVSALVNPQLVGVIEYRELPDDFVIRHGRA